MIGTPRFDCSKRHARDRRAIGAGHALVLASVGLIALASTGIADDAVNTGDLEISITDIESDKGFLVVALLNSAEQYASPDQIFRSSDKLTIKNGHTQITFEDIPYGTYAVKTFHDENANGKLDTNFVGYPKEEFGFSNDAMGKFGPPTFEQASFTLEAEKLHIEIKSK